jgi:hypothetical protein
MPPAGFEPAIPKGERLQSHALDRLDTGTGLSTDNKHVVGFADVTSWMHLSLYEWHRLGIALLRYNFVSNEIVIVPKAI